MQLCVQRLSVCLFVCLFAHSVVVVSLLNACVIHRRRLLVVTLQRATSRLWCRQQHCCNPFCGLVRACVVVRCVCVFAVLSSVYRCSNSSMFVCLGCCAHPCVAAAGVCVCCLGVVVLCVVPGPPLLCVYVCVCVMSLFILMCWSPDQNHTFTQPPHLLWVTHVGLDKKKKHCGCTAKTVGGEEVLSAACSAAVALGSIYSTKLLR